MSQEKTTHDFLEVDQIKDGVLILKNGSLRGVLMVSSVNFALKSADEQESTIYQFQSFLNSLDFPCQIVCQSRRLNITGYIEKLRALEEKQPNELLKHQTIKYREFIEEIVSYQNILIKNFFVVVPFTSLEATGITLPGKKQQAPKLTEDAFLRVKSQLLQRMEFVALGLRRCGLQSVPLTTVELAELIWSLHHQKEAERGYYPEIPEELINQDA